MAPIDTPFVHLGARSEASLGQSIARVEELCWEASRDDQGFLGLTDVNSLGRAPALAHAAARVGLRPVFGAELGVLPYGETQFRGAAHTVRLLVENATGWRTLVRLVNEARRNESPSRPAAVPLARLLEDPRGLLFCLDGERSELGALLRAGDYDRLEGLLSRLLEALPAEQLFLELHGGEDATQVAALRQIATFFGLTLLAVPRVACAHPQDDAVHRFFNAPPPGSLRRLRDVLRPLPEREHLITRAQAAERFAHCPEALGNTLAVAQRCAGFALPQPDRRFPVHDFNRGVDAESFLWNTAFAKAMERYGDLPTRYKERLDREFRAIVGAGLANAIVTLVRLNEELEARGVQRGPGAGLFTNSLIASLLGLTRLDPLRFDLPFELQSGLATGAFPLLELSIPANQEGEAVEALQKFFEGQVAPVGEWRPWKSGPLLECLAERLGKDARWINATTRTPSYQRAREAVAKQPVTWAPAEDAGLESLEVMAWLVRRMEGRWRDVQPLRGTYVFCVDALEGQVPQRASWLGAEAALPVTEWSGEELGRLRHGRLCFVHPPLLDLIGEATALAREQGDFHYSPERTPPDDAATYRLLREGATTGIEPLEPPSIRRRLRQGQPNDLHSLLRLFPQEAGRGEGPDFADLLLCHAAAALKAQRPLAFFAAALSMANGDLRRTGALLEDLRVRGHQLADLDVNYSTWRWSVERDAVRPGLLCVRGMTPTAGHELVSKRRELHFTSLDDLFRRTERARLRTPQLDALLQAGAFDAFAQDRAALRARLQDLAAGRLRRGTDRRVQELELPLFEAEQEGDSAAAALLPEEEPTLQLPPPFELTREQGRFLREARVRQASELGLKESGRSATIIGVLGPVEPDPGASDTLLVDVGGCLVRARGAVAAQLEQEGLAGRVALLTGVLEREPFQWRLELDALTTLPQAQERAGAARILRLDLQHVPPPNLKPLLALLARFPGNTPVAMEWMPEKAPWILRRIAVRSVLVCPLLEQGLARLVGEESWGVELATREERQRTGGQPGWESLLRRLSAWGPVELLALLR